MLAITYMVWVSVCCHYSSIYQATPYEQFSGVWPSLSLSQHHFVLASQNSGFTMLPKYLSPRLYSFSFATLSCDSILVIFAFCYRLERARIASMENIITVYLNQIKNCLRGEKYKWKIFKCLGGKIYQKGTSNMYLFNREKYSPFYPA